jgi:hypothetical protein
MSALRKSTPDPNHPPYLPRCGRTEVLPRHMSQTLRHRHAKKVPGYQHGTNPHQTRLICLARHVMDKPWLYTDIQAERFVTNMPKRFLLGRKDWRCGFLGYPSITTNYADAAPVHSLLSFTERTGPTP